MNIVLLGSPGVGKGTYAKILSEKHNLPHISTGDMFREEVKNSTNLGKKVKSFMDKGLLVPDDVTTEMLKERLKKNDTKKGFLLDGFPRTIAQAESLGKITKIGVVLNFSAPEEVIIQRISGRRTCRSCSATFHVQNIPPKKAGICDKCGGELYQRADEKPEAVKKRLDVYKKQTEPLVDYYRKKGNLKEIDASRSVDEVIGESEEVLE